MAGDKTGSGAVSRGDLKKMKQDMAPQPTNDDLQELTGLVKTYHSKVKELEDAEQMVKDIKQEIEIITTKDIPDVMSEKGIKEVKLEDGTTVSVNKKLFASVRKDKLEDAYEWLKENGFGDIAKSEVKMTFAKSEDKKLNDIKKFITNNNYDDSARFSATINSNTLSALIRSEVADGNKVFLDTEVKTLLGVFEKTEAKIKTPKR